MSKLTRNDLIKMFQQALGNLELFPLDNPEVLERFGIEYDVDTFSELEQLIEDSPQQSSKIVFSGHTGCGKSTLLAALAERFKEQFLIVRFSIANTIENADINHVMILFTIALKMMEEAENQGVRIPKKNREGILNWFAQRTKTETTEIGGGGSFGAKLLSLIGLKIKVDATVRQEIKQEFQHKVSELADRLNEISAVITTNTADDQNNIKSKYPLVIIDDIDKLDLAIIHDVFVGHIKALFLPNFQIIYTLPISALRDKDILPSLETETSNRIVSMRVLKLYARGDSRKADATPVTEVTDKLKKLLAKRIDLSLIKSEALEQVIIYSGGVLREVLRIMQQCCRICLRQLRSLPEDADVSQFFITSKIVEEAANNLRIQMSRPLGKVDYEILQTVMQNYAPDDPRDTEFLSLLKGLQVVEYRNRREWYDVHPLLWELLQEQAT